MNNYIIIDAYYFRDVYKKIDEIKMELIKAGQAISAFDNSRIIKNPDKKGKYIEPELEYDNMDSYLEKNTLSEEEIEYYNKYSSFYELEESLKGICEVSSLVKIKNFYIKYAKFKDELKVSPTIKLMDNHKVDFIFNIEFNKKLDPVLVQQTLLSAKPEYIKVAKELLKFKDDSQKEKCEEEYARIVNFNTLNELLTSFVNIILPYFKNYVCQRRVSVFINKNNLELDTIKKLLLETPLDVKNNSLELKDYRITKDYFHYSDEIISILVGNNVSEEINWIVLLDTEILNNLITDTAYLNYITEKSISLKQLLQLKKDYEEELAFKNYIPLVEANYYINSIFKLLNRFDVAQLITNEIENYRNSVQIKREYFLSIIGCILAIPAIYDYILKPIIIWIFNLINNENKISDIKSPADFIIIILLILLFLIGYKIVNIISEKKSI